VRLSASPVAAASDPRDAYVRYGPALVRKAERLLRNPDDAIDLVQGLFVDLIAHPEPTVELPYLYRAVTNRCLNLIRDARGRARLLEREQPALTPTARLGDQARVIGLDLLAKLGAQLDDGQLEVPVCPAPRHVAQGAEINGVATAILVGFGTVDLNGTVGYGLKRKVEAPITSLDCNEPDAPKKYGCVSSREIVAGHRGAESRD